MSPQKGWFESDDDYRSRVAREADERTIEDSTGSSPSKGWFEGDDDYRERIAREANEQRIEDSTGSAPSKGWFEDDGDYRDRIHREANERTIEDSTGSSPSKGWFESDDDYDTRVRREANEQILKDGTGSAPKRGWFEGDHDYRSRVAHEAREVRTSARSDASAGRESDNSSSYSGSRSGNESGASSGGTSSDSSGGVILAVVLIVGLVVAAISTHQDQTVDARGPTLEFPGPRTAPPEVQAAAEVVNENGALSSVQLIRQPGQYRGAVLSWIKVSDECRPAGSCGNGGALSFYVLLRSTTGEMLAAQFYYGVVLRFQDGNVLDTGQFCGQRAHAYWQTCVMEIASVYFRSGTDAEVNVGCGYDSGCSVATIYLSDLLAPVPEPEGSKLSLGN